MLVPLFITGSRAELVHPGTILLKADLRRPVLETLMSCVPSLGKLPTIPGCRKC